MVRAYNDWLAEEYCAHAPDRLIGIGVIPITNFDDAVASWSTARRGSVLKPWSSIISLPATVIRRRRRSFWAAAVDLNIPLTIHVEFGFPRRGRGPSRPAARGAGVRVSGARPDPEHHVPDVVERFNKYGFPRKQVVQMIWAGAFDRFPKLKIYVAEVQIGWVPNWMDQMDNEYGRQQYWAERVLSSLRLPRMPSEIRPRALPTGDSTATRWGCASARRRARDR